MEVIEKFGPKENPPYGNAGCVAFGYAIGGADVSTGPLYGSQLYVGPDTEVKICGVAPGATTPPHSFSSQTMVDTSSLWS